MAEQNRSLAWVIVMLMVAIALLGWMYAASFYANSEEGWRARGVVSYSPRRASRLVFVQLVVNGFVQVPNMPAVVGYIFRQRFWLVMVVAALELLAFLGGLQLKSLDRRLNTPRRRRYRTRD